MGNTLGYLKSRIPCFENTTQEWDVDSGMNVEVSFDSAAPTREPDTEYPSIFTQEDTEYPSIFTQEVGLDSETPTREPVGLDSETPTREPVGLDSETPTREPGNLQYTEPVGLASAVPTRKTVGITPELPTREPVGFDPEVPTREPDNDKMFYQKKDTGLLLILNSTHNRKGTENDVDNLETFFKNELHYVVFNPRSDMDNDLSTSEINDSLHNAKLQLSQDVHMYSCFICVILSHGNENGIKTRDGFMNADDIRQKFNNNAVPKFAGRPKVFLIQACRGSTLQDGHLVLDNSPATKIKTDVVSDAAVCVPTDADTLLAFSTTPGYASVRHKKEGTWFINECLNEFKRNYQNEHLEEMLITVRNTIAYEYQHEGGKQMPCVWTTLTRRLML